MLTGQDRNVIGTREAVFLARPKRGDTRLELPLMASLVVVLLYAHLVSKSVTARVRHYIAASIPTTSRSSRIA